MPTDGLSSTNKFGRYTGVAYGQVYSYFEDDEIQEPSPMRWKFALRRALGIDRKIEFNSRAICMQLFPRYKELFKRAKDHNTADAVLLAVYAKILQN